MFDNQSKLSIALIIFYIPAAISASYLLFYRHENPRKPWGYLFIFSLVRIVSGIVVIIHENNPRDIGIDIAAIILLNAGLFPLLNATVGLLQIITLNNKLQDDPIIRQGYTLSRILFLAGIALIIAGASLRVNNPSLAEILSKAGSIITAIFFACLILLQANFWYDRRMLSTDSIKILQATTTSIPFLIIRMTYLFLSVFSPRTGKCNSLTGANAPFICMVLVMEYIVVGLYALSGYRIVPTKGRDGNLDGRMLLTGGSG